MTNTEAAQAASLTTLSLPWVTPHGKTISTADSGCEVGNDLWRMDDERLGDHASTISSHGYPTPGGDTLGVACHGNRVEGLYSVDRNGEFAHILIEDLYWRTLGCMRDLLARI